VQRMLLEFEDQDQWKGRAEQATHPRQKHLKQNKTKNVFSEVYLSMNISHVVYQLTSSR
jgi:hypothetical protein